VKNIFQNPDAGEIDIRPACRRSKGGVNGPFIFRGDLGSSEDKSSNQTSYEQQVTIQGGASGSNTIGFGSGSDANITVNSEDPQVIQDALDTAGTLGLQSLESAGNANYNAQITASDAIAAGSNDVANALGFGAEVLNSNNVATSNADILAASATQDAITANTAATGAAINATQNDLVSSLGFGAEIAGDALNANQNVTANADQLAGAAINASQNDLVSALGFGAETVSANSQIAGSALTVANNALTTAGNITTTLNSQDVSAEENAIAGAYNFASGAVQQIEGDNAQQAGFTSQTIQNLGADLAETQGVVAATATPPPVATLNSSPDYSNWILVAASLLSVYVFFKSGGSSD
jgi:hypothetical protein